MKINDPTPLYKVFKRTILRVVYTVNQLIQIAPSLDEKPRIRHIVLNNQEAFENREILFQQDRVSRQIVRCPSNLVDVFNCMELDFISSKLTFLVHYTGLVNVNLSITLLK